MKRRQFVEKLGFGSATVMSAPVLAGVTAASQAHAAPEPRDERGEERPRSGAMASATVSFGSWRTDLSVDRFPNASPGTANLFEVIPFHTRIKAGGTVNFVIAGLHQVIVYGPGTSPEDIDATTTTPTTGTPAGVPLVNDPRNRVYRGLDPSLYPRDRVESVQFMNAGRYVVICGVLNHFGQEMYGFIDVLPPDQG